MRSGRCKAFFCLVLAFASPALAGQNQQIQQKLNALETIKRNLSFIVIGDNRSGDEVYRKLVSMAMERRPDFIVNTGDAITRPGNREEWANFWDISKPVTVPYFLTVGNHDVSFSRSRSSERTYKEQVELPGNELYYSFTAGNSLFVVLDSQLEGQEKKVEGKQFEWLEGVLAGSRHANKFVFVHHPLYPQPGRGRHHGNSLDRYKEERDRLQKLFKKHDVTMVFSGHEHMYLRTTKDGIGHITAGGGGAPLYASESDGGFYHFVRVTADGGCVKAEVVDINGKIRDKF